MSRRAVCFYLAAVLSLLAVHGLLGLETWPVTSWYMFSRVEPRIVKAGHAVAITSDGRELPIPMGRLPHGLRSHRLIQNVLVKAKPAERDRLCRGILERSRQIHPRQLRNAVGLRIYEVTWDPLARAGPAGERPARKVHRLLYEYRDSPGR